jgi:two-component system, OmpR family, sensor histidine kinase ChvG
VLDSAKTPAQRQQLLDIIRGDVGRLDRLISDISDASRLDAELSRARMAPVDLRLMLDTLVRLDSAVAKARKVNIAFTPPKAPMTVLGLELRLGQVVRNLVDNAVSFSPEGGTVRLTLERDEAWVSLAVDDDGPGIPEANREDIFKRFYSERPTEEDFGKHSGLGLAIAKQIVEAHGGQISADNRASGGARFLVRLPAA